jgi:two-component system sensor histidine kinase VicK
MEPGVPFALLGAVEILLAVTAGALAASAALRRTAGGALVLVAALLLGAVEVRTALRLGVSGSENLALARAAAALLLAAGLYAGGLGPRRVPTSMFGVVVPLAATAGPSAFAATAFVLAAVAAVVSRRDRVGGVLAAGLVLWAAAAAVAPYADQGHGGPLSVLLLRGAGALAVLLALLMLAQVSLLSKVVSAILAGVVAMALAAIGVVGTVVVSSYDRQARDSVREAADGRYVALTGLQQQAAAEAVLAADICAPATPTVDCSGFLSGLVVNGSQDFLVRVRQGQEPESFGGRPQPLTASELLGLKGIPAVQQVLEGSGAQKRQDSLGDIIRLTGASPEVAVIGVGSSAKTRRTPESAPGEVWVYGVRIGDEYAARDVDKGGFGLSFLAGDPLRVVGSNRSQNEQKTLLGIVSRAKADQGLSTDGRTIGSQGTNPTVALRPVQGVVTKATVALLAMTRDPGPALKTERDALRLLLVTSLLALVAVALAAVGLGRRTVDPVRRLTAAAQRVAAGDLTASARVSSRDEVGTLSHTFDDMTGSLARLTGDLRASAVRLETVLASMTDGLLATDGDGLVTSVNRAALEMLDVDEVDVLGEFLEVVADVRTTTGEPVLGAGRVLDEPAEVHRPDGTTVPVRVVLTPLAGAEGQVLVLRDTTREREVERMKTEFLSNVSHELRTPLTPIRGYAEILVSKPELGPDRVRTFATTIRDESLKMNRVVDLLVDVAAIEAGRVHATPRPVAVRELLDGCRTDWQQRAPQRAKDLRRRVAGGLPKVMVDPTWVRKAVDELLDNAVKYTPAGTAITLVGSLAPGGRHVRVSVRDAGPGIAEADQARLFTSFEQVDGSATRRVGGLGLGLSFVRRLAENGGFPLHMSSGPSGSEFSLDLPVA